MKRFLLGLNLSMNTDYHKFEKEKLRIYASRFVSNFVNCDDILVSFWFVVTFCFIVFWFLTSIFRLTVRLFPPFVVENVGIDVENVDIDVENVKVDVENVDVMIKMNLIFESRKKKRLDEIKSSIKLLQSNIFIYHEIHVDGRLLTLFDMPMSLSYS